MVHAKIDKLTRYRVTASTPSLGKVIRGCVPAAAVFGLGALVSFVVDSQVASAADRRAAAAFEQRAGEIARAIAVAFDAPLENLRDFAATLATFPLLEQSAFQRYAHRIARENPALVGVHWLPEVTRAQRSDFIERSGCSVVDRSDGVTMPAGDRALYLPIELLGPWEPRTRCGSDRLGPGGNNPLLKARRTGETVAATLPAVDAAEPTVALLRAVCEPRDADDTCVEPARLRGLAELWIRVAPVMREAIKHLDQEGLDVSLYDLSAPQGEHVLYTSRAGSRVQSTPAGMGMGDAFARGFGADLHMADRWWRVVVTPDARVAPPPHSAAALVSGVSISALLALLLLAGSALRSLRSQLEAARQLGQYTLEAELGAGSMGTVYRARHSILRRPTAVKLLLGNQLNATAQRRFEREVQLTALLCHPNTIAIYDFGRTNDGIFYYAMECLEGIDLQRLVELDGRQPASRVVHILTQVCGALREAHGEGLIHRDLKPANLMLCVRGGLYDFVKVLDFGLVKDLRDPIVLAGNAFVGTPLYASPEAHRMPQTLDARADLYSLGAVAFFLLTGREVFRGSRVIDVLEQHANMSAPTFHAVGVDDVPDALEAIVQACLAKSRDDRPESAQTLLQQLERLSELAIWTADEAASWWQDHPTLHARAAMENIHGGIGATEIELRETLVAPVHSSTL